MTGSIDRCGWQEYTGKNETATDLKGSTMSPDKRQKRDLHALNQEGMVLCNPRDKEAALQARQREKESRELHAGSLPHSTEGRDHPPVLAGG
jgi:hypothetical protein